MNEWNTQKLWLLEGRGWKCELCGTEISNDYQVHHCLFHRVSKPASLKRLLDQPFNLMIVCQECHSLCNSNRIRTAFWWKQVLRYGLVKMVKWYQEIPYADKPVFWAKGLKGGYSPGAFLENLEILGEVPLIGENTMDRPLTPEQVITSLKKIAGQYPVPEVERGIRGAIIGILEETLGGRVQRLTALYKLFPGKWNTIGEVSTKDLTPGEWYALVRWIQPERIEQGDKKIWIGNLDFIIEIAGVMDQSLGYEGQEHLDQHNKYFMDYCLGKYGAVPVMECGHEATGLTALYNPYCIKCAEAGSNKSAYKIVANQSIMELQDVNTKSDQ